MFYFQENEENVLLLAGIEPGSAKRMELVVRSYQLYWHSRVNHHGYTECVGTKWKILIFLISKLYLKIYNSFPNTF